MKKGGKKEVSGVYNLSWLIRMAKDERRAEKHPASISPHT
jgi:hypothetical protein